jgi:putative transcription antitermination factor YqgF
MKYLAVDYGKKNIGLAISDSEGRVAMPFGIFENNEKFRERFKEIISENFIDEIILGESKNLNGDNNLIQGEINNFANFIEDLGLKIHFVNEVFTSMEAKWGLEKNIRRPDKKSRKKIKTERIDDRAAVMILKTFLESKK